MFVQASMIFSILLMFGQVQGLMPENFATLPTEVQQQYNELEQARIRLTAGWIRHQVLWNIKGPKNYLFTIVAHYVPAPPISPTTILVCDNQANETDTLYSDVNTIPNLFSQTRSQIDNIQFLGTSMNISYDTLYSFPSYYNLRLQRIFYNYSPEGEIIGVGMTGPQERGYEVLEFIPLEDDADECTVV